MLHKLLEYRRNWAARDRAQSKPATIRLAQLEALQEAFGLTKQHVNLLVRVKYSLVGQRTELNRAQYLNGLTNVDYLVQGEFLRDRPEESNLAVAERARARVRAVYGSGHEERMARPVQIGWLYNYLLNYRQDLYAVAQPEQGMLEGFAVGLLYGQELANAVKRTIQQSTAEMDEVLGLILDPSQRVVTMDQLVNTYRYPNVDLESIDLEWRMENY
ncbi:hypothetical protein [Hymenobacter guriensis]|uniref:Uncharacterized protein n=1 Tax=Hymenobacter guriensis TaxID=2793065 RepID=A0ABS0KXI5_9BACT|nr:hypothetical protein [Hymenobacter guriensis]MBG8552566.1 hypothetical protein [Hymenobacter guriensis]